MKNNHQIDITIDNAKQLILEQLIDNHDMYVKFQAFDSCNEGDRCTDSDVLAEEIFDFYSGKNYTKNVVNLIVKLASDALGINIYIYENSAGQILRVRSMGGLACKDVFVKFTHNPIHNLGNHYDAILMKLDFHNLDLLLNTAVSEIIQPPSSNKPPPSVHVQHPQPAHEQPPPPSGHRQPPPPAVQDDLLPLDLSMKSANTTPTAPKLEMNDENLDDVDDDQAVVIDGVHENGDDMLDFEVPYCLQNIETPEPKPEPELKKSNESEMPKIGRGSYCPTHLFEDSHAVVVDSIPKYIDGFKKYLVQTNNYVKDTHDLRYFIMSTSSKTSYKGVRKVGTCHGSWECQNPYYGFIDTSVDNQPNRVDWLTVKGKKDVKICSVCKHTAKRQGCRVRKLIDYNPKTKIAIVFHMGTWKCWKRFDDSHIIEAHKQKKQKKPRSWPAKDMAIDDIVEVLDDLEATISDVEIEADNWTDARKAKRLQSTGRKDGKSLDAVGIVK